jgi:hypothetical protein
VITVSVSAVQVFDDVAAHDGAIEQACIPVPGPLVDSLFDFDADRPNAASGYVLALGSPVGALGVVA